MAVIANRIKGFADMYPPQSSLFTRMENTAREIFSRYGFVELRTPVLEYTDLFKRSIGEETDVVQKEMFTFPDRKAAGGPCAPKPRPASCAPMWKMPATAASP